MQSDEPETLPIQSRKAGRRKPAQVQSRDGSGDRMRERITLNVSISTRARMILSAHEAFYRGTSKGTASGLVESLILDHLKMVRISDCSAGRDARGDRVDSA